MGLEEFYTGQRQKINDLFKGVLNMVNETGIVGIQEKIICKTNTEFMEETGLIGIFMLKSLLTDIGQTIN